MAISGSQPDPNETVTDPSVGIEIQSWFREEEEMIAVVEEFLRVAGNCDLPAMGEA